MAYTKEQQKAIDERGKNLLVAAAAGSGKTQVMVERIINLVCHEKANIDSMLIVTFTNAAASEMKERIHNAFAKKLDENPNDNYIKKQIELLPQASIGTMHSFCIDVIRNNFNIVSVDPSFKMGLDSTITVIKSKIVDELFELKYNNKEKGFISLVDAFGGRTDEKLKELVLKTYGAIQAQPYPIDWLNEQISKYSLTNDEFFDSYFIDTLLNQLKSEIDGALNINALAIKYACQSDGPNQYVPALENDKELALIYKELIDNRNIKEIENYGNKFEFERAKSIKKSDLENGISQNLVDKTKALREEYKKRLKEAAKLIPALGFDNEIKKLNIVYPLLKELFTLISEFDTLFELEKKRKGILDFNDLEHLTLKILTHDNIKKLYKNKFDYIFFDEYQDSNLVQETIIESIKKDNNLFFVGDVKQAIYRFRLSEPMLFNQRYRMYNQDSDISAKIDLSKNFRSNKKILEFTNFIFERIMSEDLGQVDYSKDEVKLIPGMEFPENDGGVEFNIINLSKSEKKDALKELEEDEINEDIEYKFIVERIKNLIDEEIYKPKEGVTQKVTYGDIAVLFRSPKGSINKLAHLLTENDIPNIVDYSEINATSIEVLTLYDYLKIIDNRFQDEALLGALTSFFGALTLENIINVRIKFPEEKFLYNAIDRYRVELDDEIAQLLNKFFSEIEMYKKREGLYELSEFIWQIVSEKGYLMYLNSLKNGKQKRYNILSLMDKAKEYAEGESNKLFGFLLYIDKIFKDKQDRIDNVVLEDENVVKLMSIHKSKGLEFPIVILCDTKKKFNEQEYREDIIFHNKLGVGSKYIDIENNIYTSTLPRNIIIAEKKQEAISEEVRILYVAFTRAINKLIIVGATKNLESSVKKARKGRDINLLKKINNYFEWILVALWNHDSMSEIRNIFEEDILDFEIENERLNLTVKLISEEEVAYKIEFRGKSEFDIRKKLSSILEHESEETIQELSVSGGILESIENVPFKFSVTEIAKDELGDKSKNYKKKRLHKTPKSLQDVSELSPMEIGTLMHSVLEHLNLKRSYTYEEIKSEIKVMINKEKLTELEAEYIDIEGLLGIFKGEVGSLLKTAKEVHQEETFLLKYEDKIIDGIIDCFFMTEDEEIVLLDYKTDKEIRPEKYKKQLELYKLALEKHYNRSVNKIFIYWFTHKKFTEISIQN